MTQALPRYTTVEDYLDSDEVIEGRFEYKDGELIPVVPENFLNDTIAVALLFYLVNKGFFPISLVKAHSCEIQVEKFHPEDKQTRMPDLIVLRSEHIKLTQKKLTIRLNMPAPLLIAEVVSPYTPTDDRNFQEDYVRRPYQYANRSIPEYWIIDPQAQAVIIQSLPTSGGYTQSTTFRMDDVVKSTLPELTELQLTAREVLKPTD